MDALLELPLKIAGTLMALALILISLRGPPPGSTPNAVHLEFPFMKELRR